jgi:hypothetical protein
MVMRIKYKETWCEVIGTTSDSYLTREYGLISRENVTGANSDDLIENSSELDAKLNLVLGIVSRCPYFVGKSIIDIYTGNHADAEASLQEVIKRNVRSNFRYSVPLRVSEELLQDTSYSLGTALKHVFTYLKNGNKRELWVSIKHLTSI